MRKNRLRTAREGEHLPFKLQNFCYSKRSRKNATVNDTRDYNGLNTTLQPTSKRNCHATAP